MFILIDENNIVRDCATREDNLAKGKVEQYKTVYEVEGSLRYGDEYNPKTGEITPRPENYPQKVIDENEVKIQAEIRAMAISSLKQKGELSESYTDTKERR